MTKFTERTQEILRLAQGEQGKITDYEYDLWSEGPMIRMYLEFEGERGIRAIGTTDMESFDKHYWAGLLEKIELLELDDCEYTMTLKLTYSKAGEITHTFRITELGFDYPCEE